MKSNLDSSDKFLDIEPWVNLDKYHQSGFERGRPGWYIMLWWLVQAIIFPLSPHNFHFIRSGILRLFGAKIGKKVIIRPTARFTYPWKVIIGDYSWIGDDVVIYSLDKIEIGSHSVISQACYLCTGSHDLTDPQFVLITAPIRIGNGVWIAADCFIAPGVSIGANTVVGARSTVFKDLPPGKIAWGNPCISRKERVMK